MYTCAAAFLKTTTLSLALENLVTIKFLARRALFIERESNV